MRHLKKLSLPVIVFLASCATPGGIPVPPLAGQVFFPASYRTQASMAEVATAATVSLIDTDSSPNKTIATTVTDDHGKFSLSFGAGFSPIAGRTYALEAVKGLQNNRPGNDAARVRTLARFAGGWSTLTSGTLVVSRATTALSLIVASRDLEGGLLIGKLDAAGDTFSEAGTSVSQDEFTTVLGYVTTSLQKDFDPFHNIVYQGSNYSLKYSDSTAPIIVKVDPTRGSAGTTVMIIGKQFGTSTGANTVKFNGTQVTGADFVGASDTLLTVKVPPGATTGNLTVSTDGGEQSVAFNVIPDIGGQFGF